MDVRLLLVVVCVIVLLSGGVGAQTDTIFLDTWHFYKQGIVGVYDIEGNFNPGRYTWTVLTLSQNQVPALPKYVDPKQILPIPEVGVSLQRRKLSALIYTECHESDRCEFLLPQKLPSGENHVFIRLAGIHAPHLKASCEQETFLGEQARNLIDGHLSSALHIELRNFSKIGKEIVGRLVADGQDLSELLVSQGLAERFNGKEKDWCS